MTSVVIGVDPAKRSHTVEVISARETVLALKRRLSDVVFRTLVTDQAARNPGGQMGATLTSSAADLIPMANTSDKSLPGLHRDHTTDAA